MMDEVPSLIDKIKAMFNKSVTVEENEIDKTIKI